MTWSWSLGDSSTSRAAVANGLSHTITGLTDGVEYTLRIRVDNVDGDKAVSAPVGVTPRDTAAATNPLTGFTLLDASNQTVLAALTDRATLALDDPGGGSYGIRANTGAGREIGSVRLQLSGAKSVDRTGNDAPYSLYGDNGENGLSGGNLPVGSYTLTATAYSEAGLDGDVLGTLTVSFTVTKAKSPATGAPTISGTAQVGQKLTASTDDIIDADGLDDVSYDYQWLANDTDIDGRNRHRATQLTNPARTWARPSRCG